MTKELLVMECININGWYNKIRADKNKLNKQQILLMNLNHLWKMNYKKNFLMMRKVKKQ